MMRHLRFKTLCSIFIVAGVAGVAGPALLDARPAAAEPTLLGLRGGLTNDPDTAFFGGHVAFFPSSMRRLRIEPSAELGFGTDYDLFTLRANLNFKILFPVNRDAAFYPVIGPFLYYRSYDCDPGDCDDTDFGINLGMGFAFSGFAFDFTLGLPRDRPDFAFTISYTF